MDAVSSISNSMNAVSNIGAYSAPKAGMQHARSSAQSASVRIAQGEITPENVAALNASVYSFKANALVVKSINEMQGALLDILA